MAKLLNLKSSGKFGSSLTKTSDKVRTMSAALDNESYPWGRKKSFQTK